jgi:hypothetical protein
VDGDTVIDREAGDDLALAQEPMVGGTPLSFAIIVGAATAGQETEAIEHSQLIRKGISDTLLEPADGASADPG